MDSDETMIHRHVVVFGLSHTTSTTAIRDRLLFPESALPAALAQLCSISGVSEALILSTCNRVEIYTVFAVPDDAPSAIAGFLSAYHSVPSGEFAPYSYFHHCEQAAEHLFRVVSSIDSLMVGESQILSQVKNAYRIARESGATGIVLNKLFQFAITAGKRVRAETKIGEGAVSISQAGVELAKKILGSLNKHTALIIGAGEMSDLAARHLKAASIGRLFFANRTVDSAACLSNEYGGVAVSLAEMETILHECDIVISSTASPSYIVGVKQVRDAMAKRRNQPIFLIDLAAPRDIHPDVGKLYNVFLYAIDDLAQVAKFNVEMRSNEVTAAMAVLTEELREYFEWYNYLRVQPVIVSLKNQVDRIRENKMRQYASELSTLPEPAQHLVREIVNALTEEYFEWPSRILRESSNSDDWLQLSDSLVKLFNLKPGKSAP
jgi:glutamyl-tRNA reductase